jgi:hypothetical protein
MLAGATHRKTDVLDARMLANQSMNATWPRSFTPGEQGQKLRVLWAQKREAQRFATRCFNRINNIVLRFGHTFGATHPCRSQEGLAILDSLVAGNIIKEASFKPQALPAEIRQVIAKLMSEGENAIVQTKEAITVAKQFIKATQWETERGLVEGGDLMEFFMSVPGVGEGTAITWLAEVIDPRRFGNSKQLAAYCGCDPSLKVSAGKVTQHVRRKGNLRLHDALSQCATSVVSRGSSELAKWGADIAAKHPKGGFRKAAGAVARRIAVALWHVHRKGEPFSMDGYNFHRGTVNREPLKPEQVSVLTIDTFLGFLDITSRIPQAESAAMSPSVIIARFGFGMVIPLNRPVPGISPFCVSVFIGSLPIGRFSGPDPQPLANPLGANMHKSASARNTRSRRSPQPII